MSKIIALNKDVPTYSNEIKMNKDGFNGHQIGIAICMLDGNKNSMIKNYSRLTDEEVMAIINDNKFLIVEKTITQFENDKFQNRVIYYLPYYVADHSVLKPTVNNDNISGASNVTYNVEIEILFVNEGLNRYCTARFSSRNVSIMDLVYECLDDEKEDEGFLSSIGVNWRIDDDGEEGYILDFYDEAGECFNLCFSGVEILRDNIVSMRLIKCECVIDKN